MNLGAIVNPGDQGGIQPAISASPLTMATETLPESPNQRGASHKGQRSEITLRTQSGPTSRARWRQGKSSTPKPKSGRRARQQQLARGGAKDAIPKSDSCSSDGAIRSRHMRNPQPPSSADDPPQAPHAAARQASKLASLPPSSPATDQPRHAQMTASVTTDRLGRRPFTMDVILADRPVVQDHSEDAIMEAIERNEAALGPARCRFERVCDLEDGRSFELYWRAQAARSRLAAGDAHAWTEGVRLVHGFQLSAERSTAGWPGDEDADSPPSDEHSSPSVGTPQHMNVNISTVVPTSEGSTSRVWWRDATY